ncbi:MAG: phenylalanine--tRNA ligase subunit alpha [Candidatus Pacearchaeota archaeon]|nr:phenylalanine--tRNA ligase subunit alpha [Candidatus Pacearchaeota archaeon]
MGEDKLISLSPIERKVLPFLGLGSTEKIVEASKLDETTVRRALQFLENKKLIITKKITKEFIDLDVNGILYKKNFLPERKLINLLIDKKLSLEEARKNSGLSENEFQVALGVLKKKGFIAVENNEILPKKEKEELIKKFPEEKLLEKLPAPVEELSKDEKKILQELKKRKKIIVVNKKSEIFVEPTEECKEIAKKLENFKQELLEQLTPELIKSGGWKNKKFRAYDVTTKVPEIFGGKRHFYLKFLEKIKQELVALGFEEVKGPMVEACFWNCDALFMPQDHPARSIHDLYFVEGKTEIKNFKFFKQIKQTHEDGWKTGSDGWRYKFSEEESSKLVLRSQGTAISARILASKPKIPGKYFAIARCFRPDVTDASHLPEFNQLEGIIISKETNFSELLGLLKLLAEKFAGTNKIKLVPTYFPFTEPSVELQVFFESKWLEIGGAGIFRPEVTLPLGIKEKVLAWGLGIDRLFMVKNNIKDIRDLFSQDIEFLRKR